MTEPTITQPTPRPTAKITAAGLAALAATIVLSVSDWADAFDLPTFWDTFLAGATAVAAGYLKKSRASDR